MRDASLFAEAPPVDEVEDHTITRHVLWHDGVPPLLRARFERAARDYGVEPCGWVRDQLAPNPHAACVRGDRGLVEAFVRWFHTPEFQEILHAG